MIISESTFECVKQDFEFDVLEPVKAKGKSKPLQIYNVLRTKDLRDTDKTRPHIVPTQRKI